MPGFLKLVRCWAFIKEVVLFLTSNSGRTSALHQYISFLIGCSFVGSPFPCKLWLVKCSIFFAK